MIFSLEFSNKEKTRSVSDPLNMASANLPGAKKTLSLETARFFRFMDTTMNQFRKEIGGRLDDMEVSLSGDQIEKIITDHSNDLREYAERWYNEVKDDPNYIAGNWTQVGMHSPNIFDGEVYREALSELGIYEAPLTAPSFPPSSWLYQD